jgi:hypothetical protein
MLKKKLALVMLVVLGVLAQAMPAMSANSACPGRGHDRGFSDGPR